MDRGLAWFLLSISTQIFVTLFRFERIGMGRLFSRPLHRFLIFRPPGFGTRFTQLILLVLFMISLDMGTGLPDRVLDVIYFGPLFLLYADDYLTGDDDNWKKFWEGVRNKIKWKMKLPQPETGPRTA